MKILFWLADCLPDLGGLQWSTYRLAKALQNQGDEVLFLTRQTSKTELITDCPIVRLAGETIPSWTKISGDWLLEHRHNFEIIHTIDLFYQAIEPQLEIIKLCQLPTVLKIPTAGYLPRLINSKAKREALKKVSAIVALNNLIGTELLELEFPISAIHNIPNGIDSTKFIPFTGNHEFLRQSLGLPLDKIIVVFVGRFVARKRLDILLTAFLASDPRLHLVLVGACEKQDEKTAQLVAQATGNNKRITLVNAQVNCLPYFQVADLQVLLSEREGLPNSLLEGMSCALPTIGTNIDGINNLVNNGSQGFLVPVGDVKETTQALNKLTADYSLRQKFGQAARQKVLQNFDLSVVVDQYRQLYGKILNSGERL